MKLNDMSKLELEVYSYTDLTYMLLKENKTTLNTSILFKKICDLLEYSDSDYESKIGDYYTSLTLDKRFILLEDGTWDLQEKHSVKIELDEDDEDDIIESEEDMEEENTELLEESEEIVDDEDILDDNDDDLDDLTVVDEDDLAEN